MKKTTKKATRGTEKNYAKVEFIQKLSRVAEALKKGAPFTIQLANQTVSIPATAEISVEHERIGKLEGLDFQLKWAAITPVATKTKKATATTAKKAVATKISAKKGATKVAAKKAVTTKAKPAAKAKAAKTRAAR